MKTKDENWTLCDVAILPRDMRRILRLQFKEFIHHIEDHEALDTVVDYRLANRISRSGRREQLAA